LQQRDDRSTIEFWQSYRVERRLPPHRIGGPRGCQIALGFLDRGIDVGVPRHGAEGIDRERAADLRRDCVRFRSQRPVVLFDVGNMALQRPIERHALCAEDQFVKVLPLLRLYN